MNIYEATVIDRMHHLDLGLFNYQITFTYDLLKQLYGASILDKVDKRLANIPRFPELKIFKNGIQSLSRITANEYRNLMKVMIFVLDNLDISEALNKKLLNLYEVWNNMYIMSRSEEFDDQSLKDFEVIRNISNLFEFIYRYFNILIN
jgi:hypothetical protein